MDERKKKVLWAVVQDYISSAEPVASRTIARKYDLKVSSATIRNEMQDLEDEGYLEQPHTSAGRVPSIKGYRFYVDCLMEPVPVTTEEEDYLKHMLMDHITRMDEVFRNMAKVIASLTHTLSVAVRTGSVKSTFNYLQFLPLDKARAILLIVTDKGAVTHTVMDIPRDVSLSDLQSLANKLNTFLHGRELDTVDERMIASLRNQMDKDAGAFSMIYDAISSAVTPHRRVYAGGAAGLIRQPEFHDMQKVQDVLNLLEGREALTDMLSASMDMPIMVNIGSENEDKSLSDMSIIKARFAVGGEVIGSLAVLGPVRMDYDKIIGLLYFMQKHMEDMLKEKK